MTSDAASGNIDSLRLMQTLLAAASMALVIFGVALALMLGGGDDSDASFPPVLATGMVAVMGVVTAAFGPRLRLALDPSTEATLVDSYRRRFIARLAVSESVALAGFLGSVLAASFLPYAVGFCFAAVGFARIRPTPARIAADQEQLNLSGSPHSLEAALRGGAGS